MKAFSYLALLEGIVAVSFASIFIRWSDAPAVVIAGYRMLLAFLVTAVVAGCKGELKPAKFTRTDCLLALVGGGFLALHFYTWIASLSFTSVASAVMLVSLHPIFVYTVARLLYGEEARGLAVVGLLLGVLGIIIIGAGDFRLGQRAFWGDALALAGAVTMAAYLLISRGLRERLSVWSATTLVYGVTALFLLLAAALGPASLFGYGVRNWLLFLALALVPTLLGHTVFNWAIKHVGAAAVSVSILGEPIGATLLAFLILHEVPTGTQVLGGVLTIFGVVLFIRFRT